jgi:membrane-bound lytic murein transglycosylase F
LFGIAALVAFVAVGHRAPPSAAAAPEPEDPRVVDTNSPHDTDPDPNDPKDAQARFVRALTGHRRQQYTGDLADIKKRGVLRVLTRNNSTSYFLYKGVEAGFDYEVARWIADDIGVRLEMVVAPTRRELVPFLLDGKGDVIIAGFSTESARADRVSFAQPYLETPWVIVTPASAASSIVEPNDLKKLATLLVKPSSGALARIRALGVSGVPIKAAIETQESEDLLDDVAEGKASACVIEERIAKVELLHRDDLKIAFVLPGGVDAEAFAVRKEDAALLADLDEFLDDHKKDTDWNLTFAKYHSSPKQTAALRDDSVRADREGRLSPWDDVFTKSAGPDLDWRLLAAQCYQESRFDQSAKSPFGAVGPMQLLPSTSKELGCDSPSRPDCAIPAAARFVAKLMHHYDAPEIALKDRVRFSLAAYNVGPAHVDDARDLAASQGLDRNRWFGNVEKAMLLLSKPKFYSGLPHGFARGDEPVKYVSEIQTRYDNYVQLARK